MGRSRVETALSRGALQALAAHPPDRDTNHRAAARATKARQTNVAKSRKIGVGIGVGPT